MTRARHESRLLSSVILAKAGSDDRMSTIYSVIPAKAGFHDRMSTRANFWMPAFAGTTFQ
jgi:hypothetical protein